MRGRSRATRGALVSPVDGTLSQCGAITRRTTAAGQGPRTTRWTPCWPALRLNGPQRFRNGCFATIYLAPYNYHRIHMPTDRHTAGGLVRAGSPVQRQPGHCRRGAQPVRAQRTRRAAVQWRLRAVCGDLHRRAECGQHGHGLAWRRHAALVTARHALPLPPARSAPCNAARKSAASTWAPPSSCCSGDAVPWRWPVGSV